MGRGEGPKKGHMYTGLHGKRGGAKEGSHVHRSTWEEGRGQRGVTCTQVYMGRGEGPKRGHMYTGLGEGPKRGHMHTGLHGKRGGAKEGSHVHRSTWEEGRGQRGVTCTQVYMGRGEGSKRGHMYTGLHGKRGGVKEGSHVHSDHANNA